MFFHLISQNVGSTVGLLETSARRATSKLLRLATPWIRDDERTIVSHENVLDLFLGGFVDILLVVGHHALGNGLPQGIDLASKTAALHTQSDVNLAVALLAQEQQRLVHLDAENVWLNRVQRAAVDAELARTSAHQRDCNGRLLPAEALHHFAFGFLFFLRHNFLPQQNNKQRWTLFWKLALSQ